MGPCWWLDTQCAAVSTRSPDGLATTLAEQKGDASWPPEVVNSAPTATAWPIASRGDGVRVDLPRAGRVRPSAVTAPTTRVTRAERITSARPALSRRRLALRLAGAARRSALPWSVR